MRGNRAAGAFQLLQNGWATAILPLPDRRIVLLTFVTFMTFIGISKLFRDLFNSIDDGTYGWSRKIHKALASKKVKKSPA